jgi:hypothetical protein
MSGGGGNGPRALATFTWASNAAATSGVRLPRQARSTSSIRACSSALRARL